MSRTAKATDTATAAASDAMTNGVEGPDSEGMESGTRNASPPPRYPGPKDPTVAGKSVEFVRPAMIATPDSSRTTEFATSESIPPRNVAYTSPLPSGDIFTRSASPPLPYEASAAFGRVGKSSEEVNPATYMAPAGSRAMEVAVSAPIPPRYEAYASRRPSGSNFAMKASPIPSYVRSKAPGVVGKLDEDVCPTRNRDPSAVRSRDHDSSPETPPRNVPNRIASPAGLSFTTKASVPPATRVWNASGVDGKSEEPVKPATYAAPVSSRAIASPASKKRPPRYVEYTRSDPAGLIFAANASHPPWFDRSKAPGVVGKSAEKVSPARYALPSASTATARASSIELPPRTVPYTRVSRSGLNFTTKASPDDTFPS